MSMLASGRERSVRLDDGIVMMLNMEMGFTWCRA